MPYINQKKAKELLKDINSVETPGSLNFLFTELVKRYIKNRGLCYTTINDVVGALEGAKMEFYRRIAAPYEDLKIQQNGDVYIEESEEVKRLVQDFLKNLPEKF